MGGLNYVVTDFAGADTWHDADANAADRLGHFCRHSPRPLCVSGPLRECHHDVARCAAGHQLSSCPPS